MRVDVYGPSTVLICCLLLFGVVSRAKRNGRISFEEQLIRCFSRSELIAVGKLQSICGQLRQAVIIKT